MGQAILARAAQDSSVQAQLLTGRGEQGGRSDVGVPVT